MTGRKAQCRKTAVLNNHHEGHGGRAVGERVPSIRRHKCSSREERFLPRENPERTDFLGNASVNEQAASLARAMQRVNQVLSGSAPPR